MKDNLAYPYDIEGEIRYKTRVFQVGVRETSGQWEVNVFEFINGSRKKIVQFMSIERYMHNAFGAGVGFIAGYVGGEK